MGSLTNPQSKKIIKTHPQYMLTMNIERKNSNRMNKIEDMADKIFVKPRENPNFLKKGKMVISVKIRNFSKSRMTKWISSLESSCEI